MRKITLVSTLTCLFSDKDFSQKSTDILDSSYDDQSEIDLLTELTIFFNLFSDWRKAQSEKGKNISVSKN